MTGMPWSSAGRVPARSSNFAEMSGWPSRCSTCRVRKFAISMAWPRTRSARPTSGEAVPRARTRQNRGALLVAIGPAADRGEPALAVRLRLDLRLRPAPAWLAAALVAALALHGLAVKAGADFRAFHAAGGQWIRGVDVYAALPGVMPFKYAPAAAAVFAPLALLPMPIARALWTLMSVLSLVKFLAWTSAAAQVQRSWLAQIAALGASLPLLGHLFALGQSDAVLAWLMLQAFRLRDGRPWLSGLLWATACLLKPPYLLFALLVAAGRRWRIAAGFGVGLALASALEVARFGLAGSAAQLHAWRELLEKATPPLLCEPGNQGLAAIVCSYLVPPASPAFWPSVFALGALVALGLAVPILREAAAGERRRAEQLAFVFALYLTAALSPLGWHTTHLVAIPCLYLLAAQAWSSCAAARLCARGALASMMAVGLLLSYDVLGREGFEAALRARDVGLATLAAVGIAAAAIALDPLRDRNVVRKPTGA